MRRPSQVGGLVVRPLRSSTAGWRSKIHLGRFDHCRSFSPKFDHATLDIRDYIHTATTITRFHVRPCTVTFDHQTIKRSSHAGPDLGWRPLRDIEGGHRTTVRPSDQPPADHWKVPTINQIWTCRLALRYLTILCVPCTFLQKKKDLCTNTHLAPHFLRSCVLAGTCPPTLPELCPCIF